MTAVGIEPTTFGIDKFSDLKNFDIGEERKMYVNSLIERSKISIIAKSHGEILTLSLVFIYRNSSVIYCLGSLKEKMISETQRILSIVDHRQYDHKDIADELRYMKTRP